MSKNESKLVIERLNSDKDRLQLEDFFSQNIVDDFRFPLKSRLDDPLRGYPTYLFAVRDSQGIVAALHAGSAVEQAKMYVTHGLPPWAVEPGAKDYAMLFSVATRADCRRSGQATALVRELQRYLSLSEFKYLYGVTSTLTGDFYRGLGFNVLTPAEKISLNFGQAIVEIPLFDKDSWFITTI